ncbi:SapC family protein [Neptunomonas sp.]|uniref:SapC family protein n=1 Tax=Neptunomonas sp. TaxID=1971898 RepID=UPI0035675AF0
MTKQSLYYEQVVPVSAQRHRDWALEHRTDFEFAGHSNFVPLAAVEFPAAAAEYAIVFAGSEGAVNPVAILGLKSDENLYLDEKNSWDAKYIPAFVRRYPFVFSKNEDASKFTLCIDEKYQGWNQDGRGKNLFDSNGERTEYLKNTLNFVQSYQRDFIRTQAFCRKLEALDLLTTMAARFKLPSGEKAQLTGFMAIDREKLAALPGDKLAELAKSGELEMMYLHLQSLRNLERVLLRNKANELGSDSWNEPTDNSSEKPMH